MNQDPTATADAPPAEANGQAPDQDVTPALAETPAEVPATVGWTLIGAGVLMEIVPILPGFLLFIIGASMLATRVPWCQRVDNWVARKYPKNYGRSQRQRQRFANDFVKRFPNSA